ncbi:hypothetical protein [Halomonas sp. QHL1]|uniref:hypothetical protein n=1 Tax=Halomonas sp. QHL1 TaxID=1123773 RepID=UPI0008FD91D7|nr:hypothetical protein [Halomonas sp. QHL1]OJA06433.1 hypothetical protein QHL1GM_14110 [Halomonas sp. QHL1]
MAKIKAGDDKDRRLVEVIYHEFMLAELAFHRFLKAAEDKRLQGSTYERKLAVYNSYAEMVCRLYEFYMAAFKRDQGSTELSWEIADLMLTEEAQKYFDNTKERILRGIHLPEDNDVSYYDYKVPIEFGKHMRDIRNNHHHSDYRRVSGSRPSLKAFFDGYHMSLVGLLRQGGYWSRGNLGDRRLTHVDEFEI